MFDSVLNKPTQNGIVFSYGSVSFRYQSVCFCTSQMSQSFLSTNQAILLLTKTRKKLSESYSRSFVSTNQATLLLARTRKKRTENYSLGNTSC